MQQALLRYYGNATKLIITQQELLRYHGNAIWCIDHVTKENLICHNIYIYVCIYIYIYNFALSLGHN
jgi:hypothetical protein